MFRRKEGLYARDNVQPETNDLQRMRKTLTRIVWFVGSLVVGVVQAQPTYDLAFQTVAAGDRAIVTVLLKNDEGSTTLGTSRLVFTYDDAALAFASSPVAGTDYRFLRFDNADVSSYGAGRVSHTVRSGPDQVTLDITLANTKRGTVVERTFMPVVELTFTVLNQAATPNLTWVTGATQLVGGDTIWQPGTLTNDTETVLKANQTIPLVTGWNWFSLNHTPSDLDITQVLQRQGRLTGASEDLIKSQTQFSLYEPALNQWIGTLAEIIPGPTYQIKVADAETLYVNGNAASRTGQVSLAAGWNWVGYLPHEALALNDALSLLTTAQTNDLIKSQFAFAQYLEGVGWLGSLTHMEPGLGYLLRVAQSSALDYPDPNSFQATARVSVVQPDSRQEAQQQPHAQADLKPEYFAYSMNVIATVEGTPCVEGETRIQAYHGKHVRGDATLSYVPALHGHRAFLTVYGNQPYGESLDLVLQSSCNQEEHVAHLMFEANAVVGDLAQPLVLPTGRSTGPATVGNTAPVALQVYPNPFTESATFEYTLGSAGHVHVVLYDMLGREVAVLADGLQAAGNHRLIWTNGRIGPGVYAYRMVVNGHRTTGTIVSSNRY